MSFQDWYSEVGIQAGLGFVLLTVLGTEIKVLAVE